MTTWRDFARPRIAEVINQVGTEDVKALRKALRAAYPWGQRKYHPYRIWCSEIRRQLNPKCQRVARSAPPAPGQRVLFSIMDEEPAT